MLKISRKVEYALIALRHFQNQNQGKLTTSKELAHIYGVPKELLAKVLQCLSAFAFKSFSIPLTPAIPI